MSSAAPQQVQESGGSESSSQDGALSLALRPIILNFAGGDALIAKDSTIEPLNPGETLITRGCLVLVGQ